MAVEVLSAPASGSTVLSAGAVSVPSAEATELGSFELPAGSWILVVRVTFSSNSSGYRELTVNPGGTMGSNPSLRVAPATNSATIASFATFASQSSTTRYGVWARQNSGSSLTSYVSVRALRVG